MVQFAPIQKYEGPQVDILGSFGKGVAIRGKLDEQAQQRDVKDVLSRFSDPQERQEALMEIGATDEAAQVQQMQQAGVKAGREETLFQQGQQDRMDEGDAKAKEKLRQALGRGANILRGLPAAIEGIDPNNIEQIETVWDIYIKGGVQQLQQDPEVMEVIGSMLGGNGAALDDYSPEGLEIVKQMAAFAEASYESPLLKPEEAPKPQTDLGKAKADLDAGLITQEQYKDITSGAGAAAFEGKGEDVVMMNALLSPKADTASPQYLAAYNKLSEPKTTYDPSTGSTTTITPDMSAYDTPESLQDEVDAKGVKVDAGDIKMNANQKDAAGFASRMEENETVLNLVDREGANLRKTLARGLPLGNYLVGENYQKYEQAQRDFINAQLRRESGAVISPEEFDNANKQYFPQPGDTEAVMDQKRKNRKTALMNMKQSAGKGYDKWRETRLSETGDKKIKAIKTDADHASLKPGENYVAPDGTVRTKK